MSDRLRRRDLLTLAPVWKRKLGHILAFLIGLVGGAGALTIAVHAIESQQRRLRVRPHRIRILRNSFVWSQRSVPLSSVAPYTDVRFEGERRRSR